MPVSRQTDGTTPKSNYEPLTATSVIYAIGAGITAAAGTRLPLQLFIDKGVELFSFRLPDFVSPVSVFLSLPAESGLGNLRTFCLPWMW